VFIGRQAPRLRDQRSVLVDPDQFHIAAEGPGGCEIADDVAQPAPYIDDPQRLPRGPFRDRAQQRRQEPRHTLTVTMLLAQPLQLTVRTKQHAVDSHWVEHVVLARELLDDLRPTFVPGLPQALENLAPAHWEPVRGPRLVCDQQVRKLDHATPRGQ
jgi:hypothetical protein